MVDWFTDIDMAEVTCGLAAECLQKENKRFLFQKNITKIDKWLHLFEVRAEGYLVP